MKASFPDSRTLHVEAYSRLGNAATLLADVQARGLHATLLRVDRVASTFVLLSAARRALHGSDCGTMKTRSVQVRFRKRLDYHLVLSLSLCLSICVSISLERSLLTANSAGQREKGRKRGVKKEERIFLPKTCGYFRVLTWMKHYAQQGGKSAACKAMMASVGKGFGVNATIRYTA